LNESTEPFGPLNTITYVLKKDLMYNMNKNPENAKYFTYIDGTSNMTTIMGAPVIAAKGHYYQLSETIKADFDLTKPKIMDHLKKEIAPNPDVDDTYLGYESISGTNTIAKQRLFMNMVVQSKGDALFSFLKSGGTLIPLAFVQRESLFTQDQAHEIFG